MINNTGGPAFPEGKRGGMTLRDYFAAKAMQGRISRLRAGEYNYMTPEVVANDAYAFADAMLKERSK